MLEANFLKRLHLSIDNTIILGMKFINYEWMKNCILFIFIKIPLILIIFCWNIYAQEESSNRDSLTTDEIIINENRIKMSNMLAPNKIQDIDENIIGSLNG